VAGLDWFIAALFLVIFAALVGAVTLIWWTCNRSGTANLSIIPCNQETKFTALKAHDQI
jgi:membrane protein implicated in regulation of membrane protease activity